MSGERAPDERAVAVVQPWRAAAACGPTVEMVPDVDDAGEGVRLAKKVCSTCPSQVRPECLRAAAALGEPDGVWGGLTRDERYRRHSIMAAGGPDPAGSCERCALPCVPPQPHGLVLCMGCVAAPEPVDLDAHRARITAWMRVGHSYRQIADDLGVDVRDVRAACDGWVLPSAWSARRPDDQVEPCGTPTARRRHQRRGEPVCAACRAANRRATAEYRCRAARARPRSGRNSARTGHA